MAALLALLLLQPALAGAAARSDRLDVSGLQLRSLRQQPTPETAAPVELDASRNLLSVIDDDALAGFYLLRSLNLSDNLLHAWGGAPFRDLRSLQVLDLSRNRLTIVDASALADLPALRVLNLSENSIALLDKGAFPALEHLQELDLSSNGLESIEDDAFVTLSGLLRLDLRGNRLSTLGEKSLRGLSRVQTLLVGGNLISAAAPGALQGLNSLSEMSLADNPAVGDLVLVGRRLQKVDLSRAGLPTVPAALTRSVRALLLSGNDLRAISCGDLDSYPLLQLLDVSNNTLASVEDDALGRLEQLETLVLTRNNLELVPPSLPESLVSLRLDSNRMRTITPSDLQGLHRLMLLNLRSNNISVIQEGSFHHLDSLQVLDLSDNPLVELRASALGGPTALRVLYLANLQTIRAPAEWLPFPLVSPERLLVLDLDLSPTLARQLLADTAALTALRQLQVLRMSSTGLRHLRSDLPQLLGRLKTLRIAANPWNCAGLRWLAHWLRTLEADAKAQCVTPAVLSGRLIRDLREGDFNATTSGTEDEEPLPPLALPLQEHKILLEDEVALADEEVSIPINEFKRIMIELNKTVTKDTADASDKRDYKSNSTVEARNSANGTLVTSPVAVASSAGANASTTMPPGLATAPPPPVAAALSAARSTIPEDTTPERTSTARPAETAATVTESTSKTTTPESTSVIPTTPTPIHQITIKHPTATAATKIRTTSLPPTAAPTTTTPTTSRPSSTTPKAPRVAALRSSSAVTETTPHATRANLAEDVANDTATFLQHVAVNDVGDLTDSSVEGPAGPVTHTSSVAAMFGVAGLTAGGVLLVLAMTRRSRYRRQQLLRLHSMEDLVLRRDRGADSDLAPVGLDPRRDPGGPASELW